MKRYFIKNAGYKKINYIRPNYLKLKEKKIKRKVEYKRIIKIIIRLVIFIFISFMIYLIVKKILKTPNNYNNNNIYDGIDNYLNETMIQFDKKNEFKNYLNYNLSYIIKNYTIKRIEPEDLKKYIDYMDKSKLGIFLNKQNLIKSEEPKISIVISVYNREDYINSTIRSVQNQNLAEIEIIIIDDFSTDNTIKYVKEMQKVDPRIVLYKNKKNMGTLYSKSIGVLNAKGKYIYSLDSDDMLCLEDYLKAIYEEAIQGNYDIIQCDAIYLDEVAKNVKKRSPFWVVLWSKLIKSQQYRKAIYKIGKEVLSNKVVVLDDDVIAMYLFIGKKQKKSSKIGVCHFVHYASHVFFNQFMNKENRKRYCLNMITTIDAFYKMKNNYYGDFLLKYLYRGGGPCKKYSNLPEVQRLVDIYHMHKNQTKKN